MQMNPIKTEAESSYNYADEYSWGRETCLGDAHRTNFGLVDLDGAMGPDTWSWSGGGSCTEYDGPPPKPGYLTMADGSIEIDYGGPGE